MGKFISYLLTTITLAVFSVNAATVSGTVKDNTENTSPIAGAIVTLTPLGLGATALVDTTDAVGKYSFTDVVTPMNYAITATKSGYSSSTPVPVSITNESTIIEQNITLTVVASCVLKGKVTEDSTNGSVIAGAKVIVTQNIGGTFKDSATTDANGWYSFTTLQESDIYSITASKEGFTSTSVNHVQTTGPDTVSIVLSKPTVNNLYVRILKNADSTAIGGAAVAIERGTGTIMTGTTGTNGVASFKDISTGNYSISASVSGYSAASATAHVTGADDTATIYLVASTTPTKVLKGTVTDSANGAKLAKVCVVLTIGTIKLFDSTNAQGEYSITGISTNRTSGTVEATLADYQSKTISTVTLGQTNTADTATLNIVMEKTVVGIVSRAVINAAAGKQEIRALGAGKLQLHNFNDNGTAFLFDMHGRLVYKTNIASHATMIALPAIITGGSYIVSITQKDAVYHQNVLMP